MAKYLTAIVLIQKGSYKHFRKYHNIKNEPSAIVRFCKFCKNIEGAMYINFYKKEDRSFLTRVRVREEK